MDPSGEKGASMAAMSDVLLRVGRLNYVWTNTESLLIYIIAIFSGSKRMRQSSCS